jgi:hypothetical protein
MDSGLHAQFFYQKTVQSVLLEGGENCARELLNTFRRILILTPSSILPACSTLILQRLTSADRDIYFPAERLRAFSQFYRRLEKITHARSLCACRQRFRVQFATEE